MFPGPRTFGCSPALVLGPGLQLAFTIPGPQFIFTGPGLQFYYQSCLLNLYLYLRPWTTIYITSPGPDYAFTLLWVAVAVVVAIVVEVISLE